MIVLTSHHDIELHGVDVQRINLYPDVFNLTHFAIIRRDLCWPAPTLEIANPTVIFILVITLFFGNRRAAEFITAYRTRYYLGFRVIGGLCFLDSLFSFGFR